MDRHPPGNRSFGKRGVMSVSASPHAPASPRSGSVSLDIPQAKTLIGPAFLGLAALATLYFISVSEVTNGVYASPTCTEGTTCVYYAASADCINGLTQQAYVQRIWVRSGSLADARAAIAAKAGACKVTEVAFYGEYSPSSRSRQRLGQDLYDKALK